MMGLTLVTAPVVEPVSVAEAKSQMRVDTSAEDTLIGVLIGAARGHVEQVLRRPLITQTWDYQLDGWPVGDRILLPLPPLQSVTSVTYYDEDNASAVFSSSNYFVDVNSINGRLALNSGAAWPSVSLRPVAGVVVRFVAGYGDAATDVPMAIRQAMLLYVAALYENREQVVVQQGVTALELPWGAKQLLQPYRVISF